jgi:hypothetical protein
MQRLLKRFRDPKRNQHLKDEESQKIQPMPWVYWSVTDRQLFVGGWNVHELTIALIQLAFVVMMLTWVYTISQPPDGGETLFRQSKPVTTPQHRRQMSMQLRSRLLDYWAEHPGICGVTAAYLNRFDSYVLVDLHLHGGGGGEGEAVEIVELFNLEVWLAEHSVRVLVEESSPLCDFSNSTRKIERYVPIWIKYDTVLAQGKQVLIENEIDSICIQYFFDILQGEWPCVK